MPSIDNRESTLRSPPIENVNMDGSPDWDSIENDILCPLCHYNMRGLDAARCPECGGQFSWPELVETERNTHPYLFEHHLQQPVWPLGKTLIGGLLPYRFWPAIHPALPCRGRALLFYTIIYLVLTTIGIVGGSLMRDYFEAVGGILSGRVNMWGGPPVTFLNFGGTIQSFPAVFSMSVILSWPILVWLSLQVFQITMRRAKVRRIQLARVMVYVSDVLVWIAALLLMRELALLLQYHLLSESSFWNFAIVNGPPAFLVMIGLLGIGKPDRPQFMSWLYVCAGLFLVAQFVGLGELARVNTNRWARRSVAFIPFELICVFWAVFSVRLHAAFAQYLQFKQSWAMVVSASLISGLVVLNVFLFFTMW